MTDRPKNLEVINQGGSHSFDVTILNRAELLGGAPTNPDGYVSPATPTSGQLSVAIKILNTSNQLLEEPAVSVPTAVPPTAGVIVFGGSTGVFTVPITAGGTATLSTSLPPGKFWAIAWTSTINTKTFTIHEVFTVVPTGSGIFGTCQYVSSDTVAGFLSKVPFSTTTKPTLDQVNKLISQTSAYIDRYTKHAFCPRSAGPEYYNYNGHGFQYIRGAVGYAGVSWSTTFSGAGMDGRGIYDPTDRGRLYLRHRALISLDELKIWDGCLSANTDVRLSDGSVEKITNVAGKMVIVFDKDTGNYRTALVKNVFSAGTEKTYKIRTSVGEIVSTGSHPFLAVIKRDNARSGSGIGIGSRTIQSANVLDWVSADSIMPGDRLAMCKKLSDSGKPMRIDYTYSGRGRHINVPAETSTGLLRFLGFYLGDGCIEKSGALSLYDPDEERMKGFASILRETFGFEHIAIIKGKGNCETMGIRVSSMAVCGLIRYLGFHDGKSKTNRIPKWVFSLPHAQIKEFIVGYLEADGSNCCGDSWSISCKHRSVIEDLKNLCGVVGWRTGKVSTRPPQKNRFGGESTYLSIWISDDWGIGKLSRQMVNNIPSDKHVSNGTAFMQVLSVEQCAEEEVYDIEIDDKSHCFVANGFIAHNSAEEDWLATKTQGRGSDFTIFNADGMLMFGDSYPLRRAKVIRVKYTWGEQEVPKDVEEAAMYLVAAKIIQSDDRSVLIPEGTSNLSLKNKSDDWRRIALEILDTRKELIMHVG